MISTETIVFESIWKFKYVYKIIGLSYRYKSPYTLRTIFFEYFGKK